MANKPLLLGRGCSHENLPVVRGGDKGCGNHTGNGIQTDGECAHNQGVMAPEAQRKVGKGEKTLKCRLTYPSSSYCQPPPEMTCVRSHSTGILSRSE